MPLTHEYLLNLHFARMKRDEELLGIIELALNLQ